MTNWASRRAASVAPLELEEEQAQSEQAGYGSPFASSVRAFTEVNVINKTTKLPLVIRSVRPDSIRRPKTDLLTLSPLEAMRHLPTLWYSYKGPRWRVPWPANLGGMINSRALVLAASLVSTEKSRARRGCAALLFKASQLKETQHQTTSKALSRAKRVLDVMGVKACEPQPDRVRSAYDSTRTTSPIPPYLFGHWCSYSPSAFQ